MIFNKDKFNLIVYEKIDTLKRDRLKQLGYFTYSVRSSDEDQDVPAEISPMIFINHSFDFISNEELPIDMNSHSFTDEEIDFLFNSLSIGEINENVLEYFEVSSSLKLDLDFFFEHNIHETHALKVNEDCFELYSEYYHHQIKNQIPGFEYRACFYLKEKFDFKGGFKGEFKTIHYGDTSLSLLKDKIREEIDTLKLSGLSPIVDLYEGDRLAVIMN